MDQVKRIHISNSVCQIRREKDHTYKRVCAQILTYFYLKFTVSKFIAILCFWPRPTFTTLLAIMKEESLNVTIVGGGGYIGFHVGLSLWERGHRVTLLDIAHPDPEWICRSSIFTQTTKTLSPGGTRIVIYYGNHGKKNQLKYVEGSLLNISTLKDVFEASDCVIHCASYGMSGSEQMPSEFTKTEIVNVTGTENVLKACQATGVRALVYTSTYNVVFGGQEIIDGDESLPYFPLHQHVDHYSRTKAVAERLVLAADNLSLSVKNMSFPPLRTCALRLAGVVGLAEKRHLPRIIKSLNIFKFRYGYGDSLVQFATLGNVVQAHVKAAERLVSHPNSLGGQAYFISDGVPINSFEFFRPLITSLGYQYPIIVLPMWLIWLAVYVIQFAHTFCSSIHHSLSFTPILTPGEVYKTAVTHYFSCDKAKLHFGYSPEKPNDISDAIQYVRQQSLPSKNGNANVLGDDDENPLGKHYISLVALLIFVMVFLYFV